MANAADFGGPAAPPAGEPLPDPFEAALAADAAAAPASVPAPPRVTPSSDPDAPHGRGDDGQALAPYGIGKNGRPRIKPAGPGRAGKADQPRTTKAAPVKAAAAVAVPAAAGADYREDLAGFAMTVWMAGAMLPATRAHAQLLKRATPGMVNAWNVAAQKNATVRGYVEKLSGEGSWAWVIGVSVATGPFLLGCWELSRPLKNPEAKAAQEATRAELAAECETEFKAYMTEQVQQLQAAAAETEPAAA